jgi:hypothetical protein
MWRKSREGNVEKMWRKYGKKGEKKEKKRRKCGENAANRVQKSPLHC